jgi:hypothetical protein
MNANFGILQKSDTVRRKKADRLKIAAFSLKIAHDFGKTLGSRLDQQL